MNLGFNGSEASVYFKEIKKYIFQRGFVYCRKDEGKTVLVVVDLWRGHGRFVGTKYYSFSPLPTPPSILCHGFINGLLVINSGIFCGLCNRV